MNRLHYFAVLSFALLLHSTASMAAKPSTVGTIVATQSGQVEGFRVPDFDVLNWRGIPYASPPIEGLRWKAPVEPAPWVGIRSALAYGGSCGNNENCLFLNIWSPIKASPHIGKRLPVMVYIHGGSNVGGSGQGNWYTVAQAYNVVVVAINYRLGPAGWFSHPALKTGDPLDDSGNYGLLDQVKALQWVQDNIINFGGDPDNVTIVGASAGAQNVSYLMHTHLAKDLFHKAMMESNFPGIRPVSAATKSSKQVLYNLVDSDNATYPAVTSRAQAKALVETWTDSEIEVFLRSKTLSQIRSSYNNAYWGGINWGDFYRTDVIAGNTFVPPPVIQASENRPEFVYTIGDGYVLPDDIDFADFSPGRVFPKPILVGTALNENNTWNAVWPFNYRGNASLDTLVDEAVNGTVPGGIQYLVPFLQAIGPTEEEFKANYKFGTELIDEVDTYLGAQLLARNLAKAKPSVPIYVYRFDWSSDLDKDYKIPFEDAHKFYRGALHVADGNFWWQGFFGLSGGGLPGGAGYTDDNLEGRQKLSLAMKSYLYEFLHKKNGQIPVKDNQPIEWGKWTKDNEQMIVFDADFESIDVSMNDTDITRSPEEMYQAHLDHPNAAVRDFIEYYIMWSWHWNWYPNYSGVDPFDTSPGPNDLFDPLNP